MPGLVRGMARTAAVVGTATATRNAVNRRQADKNAQAYAQAEQAAYAQQAPPPEMEYARTGSACPRGRYDHAARAPGRAQSPGAADRRGIRCG